MSKPQETQPKPEAGLPLGAAPLLGADDAIREIHANLLEKHDVGWTELAVLTAKEYANTMLVPMIPGVSITQCWTNEKCDMLQGPCACGAWHHLSDWSVST